MTIKIPADADADEIETAIDTCQLLLDEIDYITTLDQTGIDQRRKQIQRAITWLTNAKKLLNQK